MTAANHRNGFRANWLVLNLRVAGLDFACNPLRDEGSRDAPNALLTCGCGQRDGAASTGVAIAASLGQSCAF
jgi:hypothetical protein